jgi:ATP-binding cassette, subfamily G (WHITE), member 2, PDR
MSTSEGEGEKRPDSAGSSSDVTANGAPSEPGIEQEVVQLARAITGQSLRGQNLGDNQNPFGEEVDPRMDPRSEKFDYETWIRSMLHITSRDSERYPERTAGISFTNLNVHGYGTATDHQKTVGNILLDIPEMLKNFVTRQKGQRIDILRDFDGLVKHGEMLVVLGPPGRYSHIITHF